MTESDENVTAVGSILTPESVYNIAKAIVAEDTDYHRTVAAGKAALTIIQAHVDGKKLTLGKKELSGWNGCTKSSPLCRRMRMS